jgi:hypothetical protein
VEITMPPNPSTTPTTHTRVYTVGPKGALDNSLK